MGAWIEMLSSVDDTIKENGRTPRWVRGLKSHLTGKLYVGIKSHPTMGAWIEIFPTIFDMAYNRVAPHDGCVD